MPPETVESTFDRFLAEFPLCFGYWNKVTIELPPSVVSIIEFTH